MRARRTALMRPIVHRLDPRGMEKRVAFVSGEIWRESSPRARKRHVGDRRFFERAFGFQRPEKCGIPRYKNSHQTVNDG